MTDPIAARDHPHVHEWERGDHMAAAFGIDGRRMACAICGVYRDPIAARGAQPGTEADDEGPTPAQVDDLLAAISRDLRTAILARDDVPESAKRRLLAEAHRQGRETLQCPDCLEEVRHRTACPWIPPDTGFNAGFAAGYRAALAADPRPEP